MTVANQETAKMTGAEIAALSKKHTISEWAVQGGADAPDAHPPWKETRRRISFGPLTVFSLTSPSPRT